MDSDIFEDAPSGEKNRHRPSIMDEPSQKVTFHQLSQEISFREKQPLRRGTKRMEHIFDMAFRSCHIFTQIMATVRRGFLHPYLRLRLKLCKLWWLWLFRFWWWTNGVTCKIVSRMGWNQLGWSLKLWPHLVLLVKHRTDLGLPEVIKLWKYFIFCLTPPVEERLLSQGEAGCWEDGRCGESVAWQRFANFPSVLFPGGEVHYWDGDCVARYHWISGEKKYICIFLKGALSHWH